MERACRPRIQIHLIWVKYAKMSLHIDGFLEQGTDNTPNRGVTLQPLNLRKVRSCRWEWWLEWELTGSSRSFFCHFSLGPPNSSREFRSMSNWSPVPSTWCQPQHMPEYLIWVWTKNVLSRNFILPGRTESQVVYFCSFRQQLRTPVFT